MTQIIDDGKRIELDSLDSVIIREISTPRDVMAIVRSNPELLKEWKEHEKRCKQAKEIGLVSAEKRQEIKENKVENLDELIPQKEENKGLKYKSDAISKQDHGESHYFGGSSEVAGCGCGLKVHSDQQGNLSMKQTTDSGQNKKYAEAAEGGVSYSNSQEDTKFAYQNPNQQQDNFQYQR